MENYASYQTIFMNYVLILVLVLSFGRALASSPSNPEFVDLSGNELESKPDLSQLAQSLSLPFLAFFKTSETVSQGLFMVCPGGGYRHLALQREGVYVAQFLNRHGYDAAILAYTVGAGREIPLTEALQAVDLLQAKAKVWGLGTKSLNAIGFSAGGHLIAHLIHQMGNREPFREIALIYPAYLSQPPGLAAEIVPPATPTSRFFIMIGDHDKKSAVEGAQEYAKAVKEAGAAVDFHLLPGLGHGFGIKDPEHPLPAWVFFENFLDKSEEAQP